MRLVLCDSTVVESDKSDAFLVEVCGNDLQEIGICDGDILLVRRVANGTSLLGCNPLVVRTSAAGLVIERADGHNGFHGVVTRIVRLCFQAGLNRIQLHATLERR